LIYNDEEGIPTLRFDALHDTFYSTFLAVMSRPENNDAFEILKLCMEGTRLVKEENKRCHQNAMRVAEYIKK
jgi:hypothetical protein